MDSLGAIDWNETLQQQDESQMSQASLSALLSSSHLSFMFKLTLGLILTFVILISIFGNLLVCVAVASDRRLRRRGNAFIVSLAIADLCVGALVMTFALANDLLEYWPFGPQLCELWISFDISLSTCSIINLCAIALDRFIYIKNPLMYNRWMTRRIVIVCVSIIWLVSVLLSFVPIALDWHRPAESFASLDTPLSLPSVMFDTTYVNDTYSQLLQNMLETSKEGDQRSKQQEIRRRRQDYEAEGSAYLPQCALDLTPTYAVVSSTISFYLPCFIMVFLYAKLFTICREHVKHINQLQAPLHLQPPPPLHSHQLLPSPPPSSLSVHSNCQRNEKDVLIATNNKNDKANHFNDGKNNEPRSSKSANKTMVSQRNSSNAGIGNPHQTNQVSEHKAAITLGIIMGTFLACWMPFFCMNIWAAFCKTCISAHVFKILTWLGYFNSSLNPAIYSIFNTEFRDAFRRILVRYFFKRETTSLACNRLICCNCVKCWRRHGSTRMATTTAILAPNSSFKLRPTEKKSSKEEVPQAKQETQVSKVKDESSDFAEVPGSQTKQNNETSKQDSNNRQSSEMKPATKTLANGPKRVKAKREDLWSSQYRSFDDSQLNATRGRYNHLEMVTQARADLITCSTPYRLDALVVVVVPTHRKANASANGTSHHTQDTPMDVDVHAT